MADEPIPVLVTEAGGQQAAAPAPPEVPEAPDLAEGGEPAPMAPWWGRFRIPVGQAGRWRVGALTLWLERLNGEWRVAHEVAPDTEWAVEAEIPATPTADLLTFAKVLRYAVSGGDEEITLWPALADRSVVSRPEKPFRLPPGGEASVYVSTPLWIQISAGRMPEGLIQELPLQRPPDTWFGPSPREGEVCYATRTFCRLHLQKVPVRPHRATTLVRVRNRAETPLLLERMKLPAPHLALYHTADGHLWTQDVAFERTDKADFAALRLLDKPPAMATAPQRLAEPREPVSDNVVFRAFGSLF